jgi:hypothetical protein
VSQDSSNGTGGLKILITATAKTGNKWLRAMLSEAYGLPVQAGPPVSPDIEGFKKLGDSWIVLEHYYPTADFLEWARIAGVVVITLTRHPLDVLVSLRHFLHGAKATGEIIRPHQRGLADEEGQMGEATKEYIRNSFIFDLLVTASWQHFTPYVVRYEDLISSPVATVRHITNQISPLPLETIQRSVALCEISLMRRWNAKMDKTLAYHLRHGKTGDWTQEVPEEIVTMFREDEAFRSVFDAWGYSLEKDQTTESFDYSRLNPLHGKTHFDNGVAIAPLIIRLYLMLWPESSLRWPNPVLTDGEDTYFDWLNSPADLPGNTDTPPVLTNLAHSVYNIRDDVRHVMPDSLGRHKVQFCVWFLYSAFNEYELHPHFIAPMFSSLVANGSRHMVVGDLDEEPFEASNPER